MCALKTTRETVAQSTAAEAVLGRGHAESLSEEATCEY